VTWVKVCGLQKEADVEAAVDAGVDAIGFVLGERSPRRVSLERATTLIDGLPVLAVLVTTHLDPAGAAAAMKQTGAGGIQPHGDHAAAVAEAGTAAGWFVLRPVGMTDGTPEPDPASVPGDQILILDSVEGAKLGGTGTAFDWGTIPDLDRPFVLAGGLTPGNVGEAIAKVRPWGVDASSGLEVTRGVKDIGRVVAFIEEAKKA
jgi:phosphoribosylanthranilate isomerase